MARQMQIDLQLKIDNAKRQLNQFNQDAQKAFKSGGANSQSYQQAAQVAAQQRLVYKDALDQQAAYNKALRDEARLREQNLKMAQQQYNPATQTLLGAVPGGNILGSGLSGGGMAALAGATAVVAAVAAVETEFSKLGDRARELASTSSNASTQLGQLRTSMEKNKISSDIAAISPAVTGFQKFISDVGTNIDDFFSNVKGPEAKAQALKEKLSIGLGQGNEDWRRLREQGVDMETDIGRARTALQVKWQRSERDFALDQRKFEVDTANQVFDLQKQAQRQQFDQQIAIQKYQENFANQQSQKAYDLSRQFASMSFQINQSRSLQDYNINKGDQTFDFNLSMSRAKQDRAYQLQDMALGGATGLDYFRAARSFNLQMGRAQQDFDIQQGREARNFGISRQRAGQDYAMQTAQAQASRQLEVQAQEYARRYEGIELQTQLNRQTQDLAIAFQRLNQSIGFQQQSFANRASDMAYDKNLDFSNFNLQTYRQQRGYNYALADFAGAARAKDPLGAAGLGSRDAAFAAALAANAQQSGQTDLFSQVNAAIYQSNNSLGAKAGDIIRHAPGSLGPEGFSQLGQGFKTIWDAYQLINNLKNGKGANGLPNATTGGPMVQMGNNTYNFNSGLSQSDQQSIQAIIDQGDADTQNKILDFLRRTYGG